MSQVAMIRQRLSQWSVMYLRFFTVSMFMPVLCITISFVVL